MPSQPRDIQVFLSHRYKSPEVNLRFFEIFSEFVQVHFEVDVGSSDISVTRLERMIQTSDAFVGIYPFPDSDDELPPHDRLADTSKYFRLEIDLALRSRKPALVFYDKRYGKLLECPPPVVTRSFDAHDVLYGGDGRLDRYRSTFQHFLEEAGAYTAYRNACLAEPSSNNRVAIMLPSSGGYSPDHKRMIGTLLEEEGFEGRWIKWPPKISHDFYAELHAADWSITDVGETALQTGVAPFLHGRCMPLLRMLDVQRHERSPLEDTLLGAVETGYQEDILRWTDGTSLQEGLRNHLKRIKASPQRIRGNEQAQDYFRSAALRKEAVFLSYSGSDREIADRISEALRKKFQSVFDYRDGKSISTGASWLDEIFGSLASSSVGIPILSESYLKSGNCYHEAQELIARRDQRKMFVFPLVVGNPKPRLPEWAKSTQYFALDDSFDPASIVSALVEILDKRNTAGH